MRWMGLLSLVLLAGCEKPPAPDAQLKAALVGLEFNATIAGELPQRAVAIVLRADSITVVDVGYHVPTPEQLAEIGWDEWQEIFPPQPPWTMPMVSGAVPEAQRSSGGYLIEPLYDELSGRVDRWKRGLRFVSGQGWSDDKLILAVGRGVASETVDQVLYTAGQASFSKFYFWSA